MNGTVNEKMITSNRTATRECVHDFALNRSGRMGICKRCGFTRIFRDKEKALAVQIPGPSSCPMPKQLRKSRDRVAYCLSCQLPVCSLELGGST